MAQKQVMRYSDAELQIIKNTFADNDVLLKAIRKVFLQMPLTDGESNLVVSTFKNKPELEAVVRKTFLPELDADAPILQVIDLWMTVEIKDKDAIYAMPHLEARKTLIDYLRQQLDIMFGKSKTIKPKITFKELSDFSDKTATEGYADMLARNTLITHTEQQLNQLSMLAGQSRETVDQTKQRLAKDSLR